MQGRRCQVHLCFAETAIIGFTVDGGASTRCKPDVTIGVSRRLRFDGRKTFRAEEKKNLMRASSVIHSFQEDLASNMVFMRRYYSRFYGSRSQDHRDER